MDSSRLFYSREFMNSLRISTLCYNSNVNLLNSSHYIRNRSEKLLPKSLEVIGNTERAGNMPLNAEMYLTYRFQFLFRVISSLLSVNTLICVTLFILMNTKKRGSHSFARDLAPSGYR